MNTLDTALEARSQQVVESLQALVRIRSVLDTPQSSMPFGEGRQKRWSMRWISAGVLASAQRIWTIMLATQKLARVSRCSAF